MANEKTLEDISQQIKQAEDHILNDMKNYTNTILQQSLSDKTLILNVLM
jgi:hypothetical protein